MSIHILASLIGVVDGLVPADTPRLRVPDKAGGGDRRQGRSNRNP